ncbi:MAG TPA: pilus assembly protein N-terminal domain-containing protein [Candidatus Eisenbacteria bacterium]
MVALKGLGWARTALATLALALAPVVLAVPAAQAGKAEPLTVGLGQSVVLEMPQEVSTVSIADAKVADAAVGSEKTVVVNGKGAGKTSLVVWEKGGHYTLYDVTCVDQTSQKQVLLQVKVSELNQEKIKEAGLDWNGMLKSVQHLDGTLSGGLFVTKVEAPSNPLLVGPNTDGYANWTKSDGTANLMTTFRALEQSGAARTLASPNLVASSGDSAAFLAGGEFPVPIATNSGENGTTVTIQWKEFGVRLGFVPTVLDGNRIRLRVSPEVSAPDYSRAVQLNGYVVPGVVSRRVSTTVEMNANDVLVIGGVKHTEDLKSVKKVPILGSVPLLGLLFKTKRTDHIDRDLLIVVSPSVIAEMAKTYPPLPTDMPEQGPKSPSNGTEGK